MAIKMDNTMRSDILVIGAGLAGLMAAIGAKEAGAEKVVLVDKAKVGKSGQSPFAAGIFTAFDPARDDYDVWMREIVENAEYLVDQECIKILLNEALPIARRIQEWSNGQAYAVAPDGNFLRRRSRGHRSTSHMLQHATPIMNALVKKARELGVTFVEHVMVTDFVTDSSRVVGAIGLSPRDGSTYLFLAPATIAAAAAVAFKTGMDALKNLTGDLHAAAFDAGAIFSNMDNQNTNIGPINFETHGMNLFVGVGGKFINNNGEEFMWKYDPVLGNRAGLPCLTKSFCFEVDAGRGPIYLDASAASPEDRGLFRRTLPEIFKLWDRAGIDPFGGKIEWGLAPIGTNAGGGGIRVNVACETSLEGLYAVGDSTHGPYQGRYTFGGNNLAFAVVSGDIAGRNATEYIKNKSWQEPGKAVRGEALDAFMRRMVPITRQRGIPPDEAIPEIQSVTTPYKYLIIRSKQSLEEALSKIKVLQDEFSRNLWASDSHQLMKANEVLNMLTNARLITEAALVREESRGWHHRTDFPMTDNVHWLKWVLQQREGNKIKSWTEPVPTPYVKPKEDYSVPPGVIKK